MSNGLFPRFAWFVNRAACALGGKGFELVDYFDDADVDVVNSAVQCQTEFIIPSVTCWLMADAFELQDVSRFDFSWA